jgi:hypothetical protein
LGIDTGLDGGIVEVDCEVLLAGVERYGLSEEGCFHFEGIHVALLAVLARFSLLFKRFWLIDRLNVTDVHFRDEAGFHNVVRKRI